MLGLSDLSGRNVVEGFEEYLTGYPVPGTEYFAFARTWYAPEMERPGCVWTHTLLLDEGELGSVPHLAALCSLFRRPGPKFSRGEYESPLRFAPTYDDLARPLSRAEATGSLLRALYETPTAPVLVPSQEAQSLEALVLEIWSQQWVALRFAFRFCTGAIAARAAGEKCFDLQVVPERAARELKRELPAAVVVAPPWDGKELKPPAWLPHAASDLIGTGGRALRAFLHQLGPWLPGGREHYVPAAELFSFAPSLATSRPPLGELVESVATVFPETSQGAVLKSALFGGKSPLAIILTADGSERELLRTLSTSRHGGAFDPEGLGLESRARELWTTNRDEALRLIDHLIRNDHNPLGERLLFALVRGLGVNEAAAFFEQVPALVATVVRLNPSAAASPELWRGPADRQWSLIDAVTAGKETSPELQRALVRAMLEAGSDAVADAVSRRFGTEAAMAVLQWFDETATASPGSLSPRWRRVLASQPGAMLDWLKAQSEPREATAALAVDLLNPHSRDVYGRGASPWLKQFRESGAGVDEAARLRLRAFMLALGFDNPGEGSDELVVRSFACVHQALALNRLSYDSWSWLEDQVPSLSWLRNWDRCERLRRGLAEKYVRYGWPALQFIRCAADEAMLRDMLEACSKAEGGKSLLRRLEDAELPLGPEHRKLVKRYV
jgi:hypothetical protein